MRYSFEMVPWEPIVGAAEIRNASGQLEVWIAEGGDLDGIHPVDGLSVEQGEMVCRDSDECGSWGRYDLVVSMPDHGEATLPYGETVDLGALRFFHGGYARGFRMTGDCFDWSPDSVSVGALAIE